MHIYIHANIIYHISLILNKYFENNILIKNIILYIFIYIKDI